jgi:glycosyltransferase involved in cell wall biosynthesis
MPCSLPREAADSEAARRRLGLPPEVPVLASFGFVTPQKHLEPALAAFARLRRELPTARYLVVGEVSPYYDLEAALARAAGGTGSGASGVTVTGRVSLETLHDAMAACDLAVNLRHPTGGESSATLVRLLALGKAVVVTDAGSFAELPAGCVAPVAVDALEEDHLLELFRRLLGEPALRSALGGNAARFAARHHRPEVTARRILAELAGLDGRAPAEAVPPLAPHPEDAVEIRLVGELAAELADLTLGEDDEPLLAELSRELVGLDLDRPAPDDPARSAR